MSAHAALRIPAPCGAANRLTRRFGRTRPTFRRRLFKSFCGSLRGGFFQKAPSFRISFTAFSFCFFFFCASLLKRKRRAKKSNNGKERVIFSFLQTPNFYNPSGAVTPAPFAGGCLGFVRTLQADLRGVMRLWRCAPAPYRGCANIAGDLLP